MSTAPLVPSSDVRSLSRRIGLAVLLPLFIAAQVRGQVTHEVVRHFESATSGAQVRGPLTLGLDADYQPHYFGTTAEGGADGVGTVFRIDSGTGERTIIYSFDLSRGRGPQGRLIGDDPGQLWGTTSAGGSANLGTIFMLWDRQGRGLYVPWTSVSFTGGPQGARPQSGLVRAPDRALWGTTSEGGQGFGTIFRFDGSSIVTKYAFSGGNDGGTPGPLILGADGSFYGTTHTGGAQGDGTIFKIDSAGLLTTLHTFAPASGGPLGALTQGPDGSLYGTTVGQGNGTLYRLEINGTFTILHQFSTANAAAGTSPGAGVLLASDGSLYGTTTAGGAGHGTVFKYDSGGTLSILHNFAGGIDGGNPRAELTLGTDGRLYGTTLGSGSPSVSTAFAIDAFGTLSTLHRFFNSTDGASPWGGLTSGPDGFFYGTTRSGGANGKGTVYRADATGSLTKVHDFGGTDGWEPYAGLLLASDGLLYGTTAFGGTSQKGNVYRLNPTTGQVTTVHEFTGGAGGSFPIARLMQAADGHLYGTTDQGGSPAGNDSGIIFRLTLTGTFNVVHSFAPALGDSWATLLQAADGSFYGTTSQQNGSVFRLSATGTFTTVYRFNGLTNGGTPHGGLVEAPDGSLFGTTSQGGAGGSGTVFTIDPSRTTLTTVHSFNSAIDGHAPSATLLRASDGLLYGTTFSGGPGGRGTVFRIDSTGTLTTLHAFSGGAGGGTPGTAALIEGPDGALYGTTTEGGLSGAGTIFRIRLTSNRPPTANDQSASTPQDAPRNLTLTGTDPDADPLTFAIATPPSHGTLSGTAPSVTYTPDPGYHGSDAFTFTVNDGTVDSNVATVSLTVVPALEVTLLNPNGGERVFINAPYTVRWTAQAATYFDVAISRNGGATFVPIPGCTALPSSARECVWTPTTPTSSAAVLRVTAGDAGDGQVVDTSDASFTVSGGTPSVVLTAPTTAVTWATSTTRTITWTHNLGLASRVRIEVSRDSAATWELVAASVANTTATAGSYAWLVSGPATTTALVRVMWADGTATDVSAVPFTIASPRLDVTAPNTAVSWTIGSVHAVRWTHNLGATERVRIDASRDNGVTWIPVASDVPNATATTGTYSWTVPGPVSQLGRIRVRRMADASVEDQNNVPFTIASAVRVTSPNTAVTYGAGTIRAITWSHSLGAAQLFDVHLSIDSGQTWMPLAANVAALTATTGSYTGRMPDVVTTAAVIRVSPAGRPGDGDVSNVPFTLATATVAVTSPNGAVTWPVAAIRPIRWTHNLGTAESVNIELSRDGGATWEPIAAGVANTAITSGTFNWVVSGPATTTALVRVTWPVNGSVTDSSNVAFRIQ